MSPAISSRGPSNATGVLVTDLLPAGSWVALVPGRRIRDRASRILTEAEALAEATEWPGPAVLRSIDDGAAGRTVLELSELSEGIDLGLEP